MQICWRHSDVTNTNTVSPSDTQCALAADLFELYLIHSRNKRRGHDLEVGARRSFSVYRLELASGQAPRSRLYRKHFQTVAEDIFLRSISMDSAFDMLMTMRYTNLRFIIIIIIVTMRSAKAQSYKGVWGHSHQRGPESETRLSVFNKAVISW